MLTDGIFLSGREREGFFFLGEVGGVDGIGLCEVALVLTFDIGHCDFVVVVVWSLFGLEIIWVGGRCALFYS